jgi:hypothetical protein
MSEINCFGDEIIYPEVVPGWHLVQLVNLIVNNPNVNVIDRNVKYYVNGFEMGEGDFGLTNCNDPDFVFDMPPLPEPLESDESTKEFSKKEKLFYETLDHYIERLTSSVDIGYRLTTACIKAGYNPEEDGFVATWLIPRMYDSWQKGALRMYTGKGVVIY